MLWGKRDSYQKGLGMWAEQGVRVTMGCTVRGPSRAGVEISPAVLFLMPGWTEQAVLSPASAEASVLGPDCPCHLGEGRPIPYTSSGACLLPSFLEEALGLLVAVTVFLSSSCGREPLPWMGSRTKYQAEREVL